MPYPFNVLRIAASADTVGIVPGKVVLGWGVDDEADGRVHVSVGGWSNPWKDWGVWPVGPPETFDQRMSGPYTRVDRWPGRDLEAWESAGRAWGGFVDGRRKTQCRYFGANEPFTCKVVSKDERYMYAIRLDPANIPDLPDRLARVTKVIDGMRGACPGQGHQQSTRSLDIPNVR